MYDFHHEHLISLKNIFLWLNKFLKYSKQINLPDFYFEERRRTQKVLTIIRKEYAVLDGFARIEREEDAD